MTLRGSIPVKVSENILPIVTAGFAKDVDEVNQYAEVIYKPTAGATIKEFKSLTLSMTKISPKVAMASDRKILKPSLLFCENWKISRPKI